MRKQIGGLCILAQEEMGQDLMQPYLFVFVNSRRNLMKILYLHVRLVQLQEHLLYLEIELLVEILQT